MNKTARQNIYVGNRFFEAKSERADAALHKLEQFIERMLKLDVGGVGVAINIDVDASNAFDHVTAMNNPKVKAIKLTPWGRFVPALAALLQEACRHGHERILYASTEIDINNQALDALIAHVDDRTLVAGLCLDGHEFERGTHPCDGARSPWNTAALWRIKHGLDRIGFPSTGEALYSEPSDPGQSNKDAGIEEVAAIAVYQKLYEDCDAKLIDVQGVAWRHTESSKPEEVRRKINSKNERAAAQCAYAQLRLGTVRHL